MSADPPVTGPGPASPAPAPRATLPAGIAVAVLIVLVGGFLLVRGPSSGSDNSEAVDAALEADPDVDHITDLTTPAASREEFVAAIAPGLSRGSAPEVFGDGSEPCVAGVLVDGYGGPEALRRVGLTPSDMAGSTSTFEFELRRIDLPPNAVDIVVTGLAACGIDLVELILRPIAAELPRSISSCFAERLDRNLANRDLAMAMLRPWENVPITAELDLHARSVAASCV